MTLLTKLIRTGNDFFARIQKQKTQRKQKVLIELLKPVKAVDNAADIRWQEENKADLARQRQLVVTTISLGFAIAGSLFFPPLMLLTLPSALYITRVSYRSARHAIAHKRRITVDVISTVERVLLIVTGHWFYASVSSFSFSLSKYVVGKVKRHSKEKLADVFRQQARFAWMEIDGVDTHVPLEQLQPGDLIVVNAGEIIPVDGEIQRGMATVDQHLLTGEATPLDKGSGEKVLAMTTVLSGRIYVEVEQAGALTVADQIAHLLAETVDAKTAMQLRVEDFSDQTVTPVMGLSLLTLPLLGAPAALAVMQSHFKYKGNTTTALSILSYLRLATEAGILVKDGRTFELLTKVDTVVFDKTGTLTQEQPHIGCIHTCGNHSANTVLRLAAAAEAKQSHPIARAIVQEAMRRDLVLPVIDEANYQVGYGLKVRIQEQAIHVGSARFMAAEEIDLPTALKTAQATAHDLGHSLVWVALNRQIVGAIELKPTVRPEAQALIQALRQRGIKAIYIISGDHAVPTQRLAETLGVDAYYAETLPAQKAHLVQGFQAQCHAVCYVGDGLNDAVALKSAAVSISLRGASALATDTAQVVLMNQDIAQIATLFDLAYALQSNMKLTLSMVVVPSLYSMGGVLFLGFGLAQAFTLTLFGVAAGVAVALSPLFRQRRQLLATPVSSSPPALKRSTGQGAGQPDGHPIAYNRCP